VNNPVVLNTWSLTSGGAGDDRGQAVDVGSDGSVVMGGYFAGTNNFGGTTLVSTSYAWISPNTVKDGFVAKYTASGSHVWSRKVGGTSDDGVNGVAIDGQGNVIVAGYCASTVDFGDGVGTFGYGKDAFVAKYSGVNGSLLWAKRFGGDYDDYGYGVAVDSSNNVIVTGMFTASVNFGGGTLTSAGGGDMFVVKLDGATGNHMWSKRFGNVNTDYGYGVAVDGSGNAVLIGRYAGALDLGGGTMNSVSNSYDSFVMKLRGTDGGYVWSRSMGGSGQDFANGVAVDGSGNVVVTGYFEQSVNFGGGTLSSAGLRDVFVAKYSGTTGGYLWAKQLGGSGSDSGNGVAVDGSGNVVLTGSFSGSVNFGGGAIAGLDIDVYVAKYDTNGGYVWAERFGDIYNQFGNAVAVKGASNIAVTGFFQGNVDFGGGTQTNAGNSDIFLLNLEP